jgi:iron complex transport system substrate-binding protein
MTLKKLQILCLLCLAFLFLTACAPSEAINSGDIRTVTDVWGREVEIPKNIETIVTLGPGATRIAAYLNVVDMIIGGETQTANFNVLMDFNPVHHELLSSLPIVGRGGGSGENNAYPEELVLIAPDVILAAYTAEAADELQNQTNIPVVSVRYTSTGLANDTFFAAMRVFGKTLDETSGVLERAEEVLEYIEDLKADLNARTADVPDSEKLRAYAGAITFAGQRGFGGTYSHFGPLSVINALNVANNADESGFYEVEFEQILAWDPDVIFLDPGNIHLVREEYSSNPTFFHSLRAVQDGRIYTMPAFNFSATNVTYALMNAYFAGTVLFPEQFSDIYIEEKAIEILSFFLGANTFDVMAKNGLFFGNLVIIEE